MSYYIILFNFNTPKSVGGMEGERQKNLTATPNFLEGAGGMEEEKYVLLHYFVFFNSPKSDGGMEGEGQKNLTKTLNSLEGAGGMEEEKYVLLHYFVLFQSSKICWRNGGRGTETFDRHSQFYGGSRRNGGRQVCFITLFCFILILQNLLEEWRERDRKI